MNLVWFLDDCANRTLFTYSGSMPQSKESKVLPVIHYILSLFHINYEFMSKHDVYIEIQMIHTDLKLSDFIGQSLYHKQSMD
jgi:hypothetical protein